MNEDKPKVPEPKDSKQDESQDQIDHLVEELKDQLEENEEIQFVRINPKKPSWKSILITTLLSFVFDFLLIISINGYLEFTESKILNIILLSVLFSVIELILKRLTTRYFFRFIISSFGLIYVPIMIVSFIIAWLLTPNLEPFSNGKVLLFFLIFIVARSIMRFIFLNKNKIIEIKKVKK
ncbi:MAG: hypothetical protein AB7V00_06650 [Bacilli bacterium]